MFKVIGSVSNVRPAKSDNPELSTTPTSGNIKLNSAGAEKMKATAGDYVAIVKAEDESGQALYAVKGNKGSEKGAENTVKQVGSILSGKSGGSLLFSSENAFKELEGNEEEKVIYAIGDEQQAEFEGQTRTFYKLSKTGTEPKATRTVKETAEA